MSKSQALQFLEDYDGSNRLLISFKKRIEAGRSLSDTQIALAQKVFNEELAKTIKESDGTPVNQHIDILDIDWNKHQRKPYEHQKEAVSWLLLKQRGILGDDMGLGKTFSSIFAAMESGKEKTLVVAPKHLLINWRREIHLLTDDVVVIKDGHNQWTTARFTIINYAKVGKYRDEIKKEKFPLIIADEAHYLKNNKAQRTKNFGKIIARRKNLTLWLLTGTPIANRPINFYQLLKMCKHELTQEKGKWSPNNNAWVRFGKRFCDGHHTGFGWNMSGASNIKELHETTKDVVLRRSKDTHLDLPEKQLSPVYVELQNKKQYFEIVDQTFNKKYHESKDIFSDNYGKDPFAAEKLVEFSVQRKFLAEEKVGDGTTLGLIEDALEQDKKVVVFTNYTKVVDELVSNLDRRCTYIDGRIAKTQERQKRVDKFNSDPKCRVIVANYEVGKTGWNMTSGRVVIKNDISRSPEAHMQAEDRVHRIGQQHSTNIQYPVYEDTIEPVLYDILMMKIQIIKAAIDGSELTKSPQLLKQYEEKVLSLYDEQAELYRLRNE